MNCTVTNLDERGIWLKPCPVCGATPHFELVRERKKLYITAYCPDNHWQCGRDVPSAITSINRLNDYILDVKKMWNTEMI